MNIKKQFDYIGQCLEELSSLGIEATDDVLYEPFYFYVSEKLVYNMKKTIPDIVSISTKSPDILESSKRYLASKRI